MRYAKSLRIIIIIIGFAIAGLAITAGWTGLSKSTDMSTGKVLLFCFGTIIGMIGILGKRTITIYQTLAIILLNTILLIGTLEFITTLYFRVDLESAPPLIASNYTQEDWEAPYLRELDTSWRNIEYIPYVIWRRKPFDGNHIQVNADGIRITPGSNCKEDSYKIFAFGGSTMWGYGSPDWGTIPAYLQAKIVDRGDKSTCIVNFGEQAYVSTQSLITLISELQRGNIPDLVIFYDGINDTFAAYQSNEAGVHQNLGRIEARFDNKNDQASSWLLDLASVSLLRNIFANQDQKTPSDDKHNYPELAEAVTRVYLSNYKMIHALATEYDFNYLFFWQPSIWVSDKTLTEEEQTIYNNTLGYEGDKLYVAVYPQILEAVSTHENLYYIANIFDEQNKRIWIDSQHVIPEGNELIAEAMLEIIIDRKMIPNADTSN